MRYLPLLFLAACAAEVAPPADLPVDAGEENQGGVDAGKMEPDAAVDDVGPADLGASDTGNMTLDAGTPAMDAATMPQPGRRPVVFIHGINGSAAEFDSMIARLVEDGWPADQLVAIQYDDPAWGCNVDNAETIRTTVEDLLASTGVERVDIVAHSMGAISSRYYVKNLGGTEFVNTYATLGGLHHGNNAACLNPLPVCVWQEICPENEVLTQLNADPVTPGDLYWVSIYSTDNGTVPTEASHLDGAENIEVSGPSHAGENGLLEHDVVYPHVLRVLSYPDL